MLSLPSKVLCLFLTAATILCPPPIDDGISCILFLVTGIRCAFVVEAAFGMFPFASESLVEWFGRRCGSVCTGPFFLFYVCISDCYETEFVAYTDGRVGFCVRFTLHGVSLSMLRSSSVSD